MLNFSAPTDADLQKFCHKIERNHLIIHQISDRVVYIKVGTQNSTGELKTGYNECESTNR